jgi:hypothetical protein
MGGLAFAHTTSISYSEITIQQKEIEIRLRLNLYECKFAPQLDHNSDHRLSEEEVRNGFGKYSGTLFDNIQIRSQSELGKSTLSRFRFNSDTGELECYLIFSFSQVLEDVWFKVTLQNITDSGHLNLALLQYDFQREQRFFNLENSEVHLELHRSWMSLSRMIGRWLVLGGRQVFTGLDYLALLIGLFFVGQTLVSQVKVVIAFMLSQTLSFLAAACNLVVLPPKFVASAMALSVAYVAIENLLLKEMANRWLIACFFGLICGFSLSSLGREWEISQRVSLVSLLVINLGVVLTMTAVASLIYLALFWLGRLRCQKPVTTSVSLFLIGLGFILFFQRTF